MDPLKAKQIFGEKYIENKEFVPRKTLEAWELKIKGFTDEITVRGTDLLDKTPVEIPINFQCDFADKTPHIYHGINILEFLSEDFLAGIEDTIGIEVRCRDGFENFLDTNKVFYKNFYLAILMDGKPIPHEKGGPVRGLFRDDKGKYSPYFLEEIAFVTSSRHDPKNPEYVKI